MNIGGVSNEWRRPQLTVSRESGGPTPQPSEATALPRI